MDYDLFERILPIFDETFGPLGELMEGSKGRMWRLFEKGGGAFWNLDHHQDGHIQLKGSTLDAVMPIDQFNAFRDLERYSDIICPDYKVTRFDVAFDDWSRLIEPPELVKRYAEPYCFGPQIIRQWIVGSAAESAMKPKEDRRDGMSVYFGKSGKDGGGCQVVVYDKAVESNGVVDAVRYESRFWSERAMITWRDLIRGCGSFEGWSKRLGELVAGAISFYESTDQTNVDRREVAPFWETIRGWLRRGSSHH